MQNNIMFVPGQQYRDYQLYRKRSSISAKGRVSYAETEWIGAIKGSISTASQSEVTRYKAIGHPVTHKLVIQLRADVRAEDILIRGGVQYYVHGVEHPGDLPFYTIVYSEMQIGV